MYHFGRGITQKYPQNGFGGNSIQSHTQNCSTKGKEHRAAYTNKMRFVFLAPMFCAQYVEMPVPSAIIGCITKDSSLEAAV